jgi:hypothetical protein
MSGPGLPLCKLAPEPHFARCMLTNGADTKWGDNVRLVAWNMGHQTRECPINELFHRVVKHLNPEILTLNEYVHGSSREALVNALSALGLAQWDVSERQGSTNQVLIASRHRFERGDLKGPDIGDGHGSSNFLHVVFSGLNMEVVGIRVPFYEKKIDCDGYWSKLFSLIESTSRRRIVYVGDFNANPDQIGLRIPLAEISPFSC